MIRFLLAVALLATVGADNVGHDNVDDDEDSRIFVNFRLSARALPNKDTVGKSDPYVEVYYTSDKIDGEKRLGKTEIIQDDLNPSWDEMFTIEYTKGNNQRLHLLVFDDDVGPDEKLGDVTVELGKVAKRGKWSLHLNSGTLDILKAR